MLTPTDQSPERLGQIPDAGRGDPTQIELAAELLADPREDVALVVGDGVARSGVGAVEAAVEFAEAAGARVHGEILACEVDFPTGHDQWVSYVPPDEDVAATLLDVDNLVLAGCSTNTTLTRHERELVPSDTTCVHVSDDAWQVGKNQPADAAVLGDPGRVLAELADHLRERVSDEGRAERLERVEMVARMVERQMAEMAGDEADEGSDDEGDDGSDGEGGYETDDPRASKAELVDAMQAVAGDAYVVDEGVTAKYAMLTRWDLEPEQYVSNKGGGLGYGLPASVGAAIAEDQSDDPRDVVGFVGDGSYLYYPQTLYSAARYDVDLTVVIPDNRNYRILKDNALDLFGSDEGGESTVSEADFEFVGMDFEPPVDIPANAESHGARGHLVEDPTEIGPALADALSRDGPDVLDVLVHD
jgi:benzoylformate decarboxylase